MKKFLVMVIACVALSSVSLNAQNANANAPVGPSIFSFDIATFGAYTGDITGGHSFGFTFTFDDAFAGGFHHYDIGGTKVKTLDIEYRPAQKLTLGIVVGVEGADQVFGVGLGFEFFQKKQNMFSSMAAFIRWMGATGAGNLSIDNGGVVLMGLSARFGI